MKNDILYKLVINLSYSTHLWMDAPQEIHFHQTDFDRLDGSAGLSPPPRAPSSDWEHCDRQRFPRRTNILCVAFSLFYRKAECEYISYSIW